MRVVASSILLGLLVLKQTVATAIPKGPASLPSRLLHHWPNGTWVENISVRPNGNLLVSTSTPNGSVYQVHEPWTDNPNVELVYTFDDWVDRLIGIGESTPDTFVVVGSRFYNADYTGMPVANTFCAMELDFSRNPQKPTTRLIARMPEAYLLQSVSKLPWDPATVLISDQYLLKPRNPLTDLTPSPGQVWRLDTRTGKYSLVMTNYAEMNSTGLNGPDTGINGIKVRGKYAYWVNGDIRTIFRIKIDNKGVPVHGAKPEKLAYYATALWDDFTFGPGNEDTIWAAGDEGAVFAVSPEGKVVPVVGVGTSDNLTFPGPTATGFGRHKNDKNILYVSGNLLAIPDTPLNGKLGGWVRAVDTTGFHF